MGNSREGFTLPCCMIKQEQTYVDDQRFAKDVSRLVKQPFAAKSKGFLGPAVTAGENAAYFASRKASSQA